MCHTGFQYTPVASIATCVQPASVSQAASASRPAVVVANSRCSAVAFRPAAMRTHAFTRREWDIQPGAPGMQDFHSVTSCIARRWRGVRRYEI